MALTYLLLASFIIMLTSLSGIIFVTKKIDHWTSSNLQYLVAFSAGALTIVSYNLLFEAFELGENNIVISISIILGFLFFYLFEKLYPEVHCHHEDEKCLPEKSKRGAKRILIGDSFHNIGDGIFLAPIFAVNIRLGFIAAFGILAHEFVQNISQYFVLRTAGYSAKDALIKNFLISATILIGAIGGFYLSLLENLIGPLIGLAAGAFIYILTIDLIPESIKHSHRERKYLNFAFWALLGVLLVLAINLIVKE